MGTLEFFFKIGTNISIPVITYKYSRLMSGATRYVKWTGGKRELTRGGIRWTLGRFGMSATEGWKQRGEAVRAFYGVINFVLSSNYKLYYRYIGFVQIFW